MRYDAAAARASNAAANDIPARTYPPNERKSLVIVHEATGHAIASEFAQEGRAVALPGTETYEAAVRIWNAAVRHRPAVVVACKNRDDVVAAIRAARRHDLPLSVRGGGHDWVGRALRDGGLVVDLSGMRDVEIDERAKVATIGGGALAQDVIDAAAPHALAAVTGNTGAVGMAGLTLGGGHGPLNPAYGLACDNLVAAEVVLADGRVLTTNADVEPELLWALRGGGGNFGVVTSMRIRLHAMGSVLAGMIVFPWDDAKRVLLRYADLARTASPGLGRGAAIAGGPEGAPVVMISALWHGDSDRDETVLDELAALGEPSTSQVGRTTYRDFVRSLDGSAQLHLHGGSNREADDRAYEIRTLWFPDLTSEIIDHLIAAGERFPSSSCVLGLSHFHGACTQVREDETAFGMRRAHYNLQIVAGWSNEHDDGAAHRRWARDVWRSLEPLALPGGYANVLAPTDTEQVQHAYGKNAGRLRAAKHRYDPQNVFASAIPLPN